MIAFRFSLSVIIFFILALHISLPLCFVFTTVAEIIVVAFLLYVLEKKEYTPESLWFDILAIQYVEGGEVNLVEMIHTCGARALAMLLGFFAVGWYIPTILIYLTTCVDIKKGAN